MQEPPSQPPSPDEQPRPAPPAPPAASVGTRWGEPGYQGPPDPDRRSRLAVAWILGVVGVAGLVVVALAGFAILYAAGQRQPAPVAGAPSPTVAPQRTVPPSTPGPEPASPTTGASTEPPAPGGSAPFRASNAFYSIRVPDGFQDVTDTYRALHPSERDVVQALAGAPGASPATGSSIVISRLPSGSVRGRSLEQLAAARVRALRRGGASAAGSPRHSSIGPDPAVEVDLTMRSSGRPVYQTQVLCIHDGRLWEIAVAAPLASRSLVTQAWTTVKTGWQWR
jgi:hypothetical protein